MSLKVVPRRRNTASIPDRIPVAETNLTAEERALLPDPNWLTEDDADAIMSMRAVKEAGGKSYSLEEVLQEHGFTVERSNPARCAPTTSKARRIHKA
ncbi:MAG: hypothetical protein ABSF25_12535 [Bryobacteraceae bacterium]|jgi:hypothetical protein